ncbi:MAG: NAD-dependent epimerase/dehydratase family protein [Anaerolineae bacterium]|nr:NAD-dependent epimerase/dehydratase family protein [Anaerolineae bacterium]
MKILVTGGTSAVGRMATARLVNNGHEVTVIGRRPDIVIEGARYQQCDIVQRKQTVKNIIDQHDKLRAALTFENRKNWSEMRQLPYARVMFGYSNFWASIDARDSAQAIEKGLLADYKGSHPLWINDSHNSAGVPTEMLAAWFYSDVPLTQRIPGTESLVSIEKARNLLGFEPEYSISRFWN